jgi:hypothetical protein
MVSSYAATDGSYVYSDWINEFPDATRTFGKAMPYAQRVWRDDGLHGVTALVETARAISVGGFDESMEGWEEGDFFTKFAIHGFCGCHVNQPLFVYRVGSGKRRSKALASSGKLMEYLSLRYGAYINGEKQMSSCCGGNGSAVIEAKRRLGEITMAIVDIEDGYARMEFTGPQVGGMTFFGGMGRKYKGGNNPEEKYERVHKDDVEKMALSSYWKVVAREQVIAANMHIPEVMQVVIPATPAAGIVVPQNVSDTVKPPEVAPEVAGFGDQQFGDDASAVENRSITEGGKRKPGRPKRAG